jgi:hypothetical protein
MHRIGVSMYCHFDITHIMMHGLSLFLTFLPVANKLVLLSMYNEVLKEVLKEKTSLF